MRRILLLLTGAVMLATMLALLAGPSFGASGTTYTTDPAVNELLNKVRQATAKYQTPKKAEDAGSA